MVAPSAPGTLGMVASCPASLRGIPMLCSPSGRRALHSLDGDALHVLGTPGVDVALRVLNSLEGWVSPVLLQGTAAVTAEGHGRHQLPFARHPQSSPPCPSHPSPSPGTSKTGTTSVWELRRTERRRGFVPCQVRISTTRPWHTCGARAGCHQGPGWGQRGWDRQAGPKKHQPEKSALVPPGRSPLSPLGEGRQQEQACLHPPEPDGARVRDRKSVV